MSIYKDPTHAIELRMDAAKAAIRYETPTLTPVALKKTEEEVGPLAERLKAYAMQDAIEASEGKVVPIGPIVPKPTGPSI